MKRELGIFLIVGISTVFIDFVVYSSLVEFEILEIAKAIGFIVGSLYAYFANRFWTFRHKSHKPGSAWRFFIIYNCTLGANILVNTASLKLLNNNDTGVQLAFLLATGTSATLNFVGMKFYAFKKITPTVNQ